MCVCVCVCVCVCMFFVLLIYFSSNKNHILYFISNSVAS